MTDLTDIPGIGPKTAESLRAIGIDSGERLYAEYLAGESSVADALHSERRLIKHVFSGDPPAIDHGVGPVDARAVAAVTGFARDAGATHRYLAPHAPYNIPAEQITPASIDWSAGLLGGERDVLGVVYDSEAASETVDWPLSRLDDQPTAVTRPSEELVRYEANNGVTLVDRGVVERASALTGRDYDVAEHVRVAGGRDASLVQFDVGADGLFLLAAPRVRL